MRLLPIAKARGIRRNVFDETQPFYRTTLGEVFNSTELFAAYPQLRNARITFVQGKDFEDNGIHYPNGSTSEDLSITLEGDFHYDGKYLYPNLNESTILTLLHEIQHAIQHIEGFAGGASMDLAVRNSPAVKDYDRRIDALQNQLNALYHEPNFKTSEEALFGSNPQSQEYYDLERKLDALIDEKENFIQNAMNDGTARNLYLRSAGETEARHVMTRHSMTEAQRRDTLLRDTEDFRYNELLDENGETYNQTANSTTNQQDAETEAWSNIVDQFMDGKISRKTHGNLLHVMDTPIVFSLVGMDRLPIEIRVDNMHKILLRKHHISPDVLKQIPMALADPIMIFKSEHDLSRKRDSRIVFTELREKDNNGNERFIMAAITLGKNNLSK